MGDVDISLLDGAGEVTKVIIFRTLQMLPVLAYDEIVLGTQVEPAETITLQQDEMETANGREPLIAASAGV